MDIMKPTPGKPYTIQDENSLSQISLRAYGDFQYWPRIWNANQTRLRSGNPDLIFPGEVILIPFLHERSLPPTAPSNRDPNGIYIELDGREIRPMTCRILRTMNTIANGFQCTIPYENGLDPEIDKRVKPKTFTPLKVSIGGERILTGLLYGRNTTVATGTTLTLNGATSTVDLVDSTLKPPYEFKKISLEDLTRRLVEPHGFTVKYELDTDAAFDRVTANKGDTIFNFLLKLTRQRGALLSCDTDGNVIITQAKTAGTPVATLEEGVTAGVTGWGINHDDRKTFNTYRATGRSPLGNNEGIAVDNKVPRSRFTEISADESTAGDIEAAATWAKNKTLADALTFPLTVTDWFDPSGNLWEENTLVSIKSKSMFIPDGFTFLVKSVEYVLDGSRTAILNFVPPTVYTQGEVEEPW